ncbi:leucine-rich repeat and calponin homology domain-containing protein 4 isoform X2 [Erpetoichthys calabaricus]|uniref:Leucine-rich repeat and calponin homology domain-containing protein 4-like n=1 Tax=Erpetoichthys calabaricus TaxID=27687 RepID=A0A8C4S308_ERPCA|nr:leucine-rich repeat and calponin homology domain-containing protein 4 isoform X2 [Erpetoichthys calabaricus]
MAAGEDSPLPAGIAGSRSVEKALEEAVASGALNLSNRKLKEFPRTARNYDLSDVTQADLSKNRLSELPEEVCQFISLESLSLYHNCARSIPEAVCNLQALTYINISRNQLSSLPPFLCQLPLKVLNASNNKLSTLPNNIETLVNLRQLDVSCNEIQSLPPQLGSLESLRDLNVRRNQISILPEELSELPLVRLDFSCNRVTRIPVCYRHLRHLQAIILDNNPLQSPPAQVCTKGKVHIFKYLNIEACNKTVQELTDFDRMVRPTNFTSCLSDEFYPLRQYGGLDSGFNSVDSGSKRWSGNESADEFSELSLRMADITRENKLQKEIKSLPSSSLNANGDTEQIDFIDSSLNEDDEEESKSDVSPLQPPQEKPKTSSPRSEADSKSQKTRPMVSPDAAHPAVDSPPSEDRRRILQIWQERERQQQVAQRCQGMEKRENRSVPRITSTTPAAVHPGTSSGVHSDNSFTTGLRQRSPSAEQMTSPVSRHRVTTDQTQDLKSNLPSPKEGGVAQKPSSFLFRSASKNNVKNSGSVHSLVDAGVPDSRSALRTRGSDHQEDQEQIVQLRKIIESKLRIILPEDLSEALSNGATLCQLVNHMRPRSVSIIYIPSPAVPKLSTAKCRLNVENFIKACRKLGVPEAKVCFASDIHQGNVDRILDTVEALLLVEADFRLAPCLQQLAGFCLFYAIVMLLIYLALHKLSLV